MMGWSNQGWNGWMLAMMLAWPLLVAMAVWAVVALTRSDRARTDRQTPRQILDRRLAAADIDAAPYTHARALLENRSMSEPTTTGSE